MFAAFPLAIAQLGDPHILRVLAKSLALTILLFAAIATLAGWLLTGTNPCGIGPLDFRCEIGAGGGAVAASMLALAGLWFLFPAVAIGVVGLFADEVVEAVEVRHYPAAAGRNLPFGPSLILGLRSAGRMIGWNLLAFPFYLLLLVTGVGTFLLFLAVNALVLGRDLGEMVAVRHFRGEALASWLAATRGRRALLGLAATGLFMIPFANLLAPVLGAAMATHLFHRRRDD
ncbi:EI24 domain-containing protein [Sphingosinicella rhizophila]|uniref:EI24 domain-containing protein n=1 Tax=Sphingosinicella rhizophila TaxID=3050082 RepID=A0ABU3Q7B7_9SPHN|nr:EI24 domain-containing protein [Sphingosinicella sp. GR2756]MDT9599217.1 EI24 domain-containing protein [Sphingosinicella sp. GR2756]